MAIGEYFGRDRRRSVRVEIVASMHLVVFDAQGLGSLKPKEAIKLRTGIVRNISIGGVCLTTNDLIDEWIPAMLSGTIQVALKFSLPSFPQSINATAKTVWIRKNLRSDEHKYILGLEFVDIEDTLRTRIKEYIAGRSKEKR
jgi:c-di-GMP-binding flagellar brake protein YcgR